MSVLHSFCKGTFDRAGIKVFEMRAESFLVRFAVNDAAFV
jgi:hypothetical protein